MKLRILASLMAGSMVSLTATSASAQDLNGELFRPQETPQEAMEREFFDHDKSILRSRDIGGVLDPAHLIGLPNYNDNAIILDAKSVNRMHRYLQEQQTYSNPTLRVPDLISPFNTSVQLLPVAVNEPNMSSGPGFVTPPFERPGMVEPPTLTPAPVAQPPAPMPMPMPMPGPATRQPVPAKF